MINRRLIIATTGLSRTDIHKISFPKYIELINFLDCREVYWIINIDRPEQLDYLASENDAIDYLRSIIPNTIITTFTKTNIASFRSAFIKVVRNIHNILTDDSVIFWLEDDWDVNLDNKQLVKNIVANINPSSHVNLTKNPFCSFNPSFWGHTLFRMIFDHNTIHGHYRDPERHIMHATCQKLIDNNLKLNMINCNKTNEPCIHAFNFYQGIFMEHIDKDLDKRKRIDILANTFLFSDRKINGDDDACDIVKQCNEGINNIIMPENIFFDIGREWLDKQNDTNIKSYLFSFKEKK